MYKSSAEICMEEEQITKYSTAMYRAPEMADLYAKTLINEKVDTWALGCLLYVLAFLEHPFQDGGNLAILSGKYEVPDSNPYSKHVAGLIKKCLTKSQKKRPSIEKVLELVQSWKDELSGGRGKGGREKKADSPIKRKVSPKKKKKKTKKDKSETSTPSAGSENTDEAGDWADDGWNPFGGRSRSSSRNSGDWDPFGANKSPGSSQPSSPKHKGGKGNGIGGSVEKKKEKKEKKRSGSFSSMFANMFSSECKKQEEDLPTPQDDSHWFGAAPSKQSAPATTGFDDFGFGSEGANESRARGTSNVSDGSDWDPFNGAWTRAQA